MAKVCRNIVTMYSSVERINEILDSIKTDDKVVSFNKFLPTPPELVEASKTLTLTPSLVERFGAMDVGTWRLKKWGCPTDTLKSEIVDEAELDFASKLPQEMFDKLTPEEKAEAKSFEKAVAVAFETTETPNAFVMALSEKFPDMRMHYSYDSEPEDVSGWLVASNGEVHSHEHYNNCLAAIKLHIEPFREGHSSLLSSILGGEDEDSN
jgi:hypothetical protein